MLKIPFTAAVIPLGLIALGMVGGGAIPSVEPPASVGSEPTPISTPPLADPSDAATIRGRVIDPMGQPVAGARVTLSSPGINFSPNPSARTRRDGRYELTLPGDQLRQWTSHGIVMTLVATAPGFGMGWIRMGNTQGDGAIRLVPEGPPIRGRILDRAGNPVGGVRVSTQAVAVPRLTEPSESPEAAMSRYLGRPEGRIMGTETESFAVTLLAMTAGDGWFTLRGVGADRIATLQLSGPTIATTEVDAMTRGGPEPKLIRQFGGDWADYHLHPSQFEWNVEPTRIIEGVVRDADSGQPLVGWRVGGSFQETLPHRFGETTARTDAEGRYRLVGLPSVNQYSIRFRPPRGQPYLAAWSVQKAAPDQDTITCDLSLRKAVLVRGRVTDAATGRPISGLLRVLPYPGDPDPPDHPEAREGEEVAWVVDNDGRYEVVAPPGRSVVAFAANEVERYWTGLGTEQIPGYDPATRTIGAPMIGVARISPLIGTAEFNVLAAFAVEPGATTTTLNLQAKPEPTLDLTVLDGEGNPLVGIMVQEIGGRNRRVRWHEASQLTLLGFPLGSSRRISAWHSGRKLAGSRTVAAADGPSQTIQLGPWGEVRGRLVGADGTPRGNARLTSGPQFARDIRAEPLDTIPQVAGLEPLRTDAGGRFHLTGLLTGVHYGLSILENGDSLDGDLFSDLVVAPGEVKDLGDVRAVRPDRGIRELGADLIR